MKGVSITANISGLDEAVEKLNRLIRVLEEAKNIINSFSNTVVQDPELIKIDSGNSNQQSTEGEV